MRIRVFLIATLLLLPGLARAATVDVAEQGAWTLRSAAGAPITRDYFCASMGKFAQGYGLTVARNLLGQSSWVITWPGLGATPGSTVSVRINLDEKNLHNDARDVTATAQSSNTLVAALGWDDAALGSLADAAHISITIGTTTVRYALKDQAEAIHSLASCTAMALNKLPGSSGLSTELRHVLEKAGISNAHQVPTAGGPPHWSENFMVGDLFGGSEILMVAENKPDITQSMLDDVDQLEARCHARFSSDLGAPVQTANGEWVTAEATCTTLHSGSVTTLVFVRTDGTIRAYYIEANHTRADQARTLRDKIAEALK